MNLDVETKIEESEKVGSRWESNPGHLCLELVSEPDPQKIEKEGLPHRPGWKCTCARYEGALPISF